MARHTGIVEELLWAYSERRDGAVHSLEFYAYLRGIDVDSMFTQTQFQQWFRSLMEVAIENDCYGCITAQERMLRLYAPIVEEIRTSGRYNAFEKYVYQRLTRYKFRSHIGDKKMAKKNHRVYSHDGDGYANNQAACQKYAEDMGLRWGQYEVVQEEASNLCQTAALYVTSAAKKKIDRKKRQWANEVYG